MIRPIDIRLNAAHPELKPPEAVTYTGSPSTVLIRGIPPNYGRWAITAVSVAATFPDGSTTTRAAVQSANGVWVATLPGTATSGRTTDGFRVIADGIDENGEAATGYILAVADFAVASLDVTPAPQPGETSWQMLYFDAVPSVLRKGDVAKIDGVLKFYNGEAWEAFATPPTLDDAVTRTSANGVKSSGIWSAIWGALAALPTGFASLYDWVADRLSGKLDADSGTMTGRFNLNGILNVNYSDGTAYEIDYYGIRIHYSGGVTKQISMPYIVSYGDGSGYMALVNNLAPDFSTSTTYYKGDLVKNNGALFICTATSHTGAWSTSDFSVATIQEALAQKLGHEGPWVNGYIDVLERVGSESVPYGIRIYRDKIAYGAFTNTVPRGFTPIRTFNLPNATGTLALKGDVPTPATLTPYVDYGSGYVGDHTAYAREDHVHPSDTSKQNALSAVQLANIGSVSEAVDFSPTTMYAAGQAVAYNGAVYVFTASHGGAWTGTDVKKVNLLADKLDKSGPNNRKIQWNAESGYLEVVDQNGLKFIFPSNLFGSAEFAASREYVDNKTPYNLTTKTIDNGAVTLDDRASNSVTISATLSPNTLTINFPTAPTGKLRDFAMRLNIAAGVTAPEIAWPQGVTLENDGGEIPEIADGGTGGSSTILYFSESENNGTTAKFTVKGETLVAITQA